MMNLIEIDEIKIKELEIYHHLRENVFRRDNSFIADSPKVVNLLLSKTDVEIKSILATREYYDEFEAFIRSKNIPKLYLTTKAQMQTIVGHKIHHNCMMHGIRPAQTSLQNLHDNILMLDDITSSENVGSMARSGAALGVNSYLLPNSSPHPFNRRALRVSMGHSGLLKYHLYTDIFSTIKELQSYGYKIYAAEVTSTSIPLSRVKISEKWVLLMGHEGKGLADEILTVCDEVVTIEMVEGIKSFNVAVAASIIMYNFLNH